MNDGWSSLQNIKMLISLVFNIPVADIKYNSSLTDINNNVCNATQEISNVLQNRSLLANTSIATLVSEQLKLYPETPEKEFQIDIIQHSNASFSERWQSYISKLEKIVQEVQRRFAQHYELNAIMPPQKQMLKLQQECLDLTREYYGPDDGNISCFYLYYIRMCEEAHITRFIYYNLAKNVTADGYLSLFNLPERKQALQEYETNIYQAFIKQSGAWAQGRSDIDATAIANVFYYKYARQLLYLHIAKNIVVELMQTGKYGDPIENFGQLPINKKEHLWQLIQEKFPADTIEDQENIFYKYAQFCNYMPGACYTNLPIGFDTSQNYNPTQLHSAIKIAGLRAKQLLLISRSITENWTPKRYLILHWQRKYTLENLRPAGVIEQLRIWPNEMPYSPSHGLSLCGDGLIEGLADYGSTSYEWNTPIDIHAEIDNTARDIEKMFREMSLLCPNSRKHELLPGEAYIYMFQNMVAYSTQSTQHLHIGRGTLKLFKVFNLSSQFTHYNAELNATFEFVLVGHNPDAIFLRVTFDEIKNEPLIRALIDLNNAVFKHFGGPDNVDVYIHLSRTENSKHAFIFEPHARLHEMADRRFINPETGAIQIRKPQYLRPEGDRITVFPADHHVAAGLEFLRQFFDDTCKKGMSDFLTDYIKHHF